MKEIFFTNMHNVSGTVFSHYLLSVCDKTVNKEMVLMVFVTNLVRCHVFFPEIPGHTRGVVTNSQCWFDLVC